ncbi:MAG TPA: hypothetical protein VH436_06520 [Vicinamibacterales bacterium]
MTTRQQVVIQTALGLVLLAVISNTRADPDLWGHVLFGRDTVASGHLTIADPYSFTSDRSWVNHEWLAECAMFLAFALGGGPGLVIFKMIAVLAMVALVWSGLNRQGVDPGARNLLVALTIVGTFPQTNHVRPQLFSIVAFACLLRLLVTGRTLWRLAAIPLVFALWVNLHGGWIVGGGVLAVWALATLPSTVTRTEKATLFASGVVSLLATLVNPYGWRMWLFLQQTVGFGRAEITDWQPAYRLGVGFIALWMSVCAVAIVGAMGQWRSNDRELRRLAVVAMLAVGSFQVSRLLSFFVLAVVLLLGREIAAAFTSWRAQRRTARRAPGRLATAVAVFVLVALIGGAGVTSARNLTCVRIGADQPEPEVVAMAKSRDLRGRLAIWFDWGEYAIWHLAPAMRVSIDGRRETVYTDPLVDSHLNFYYVPSTQQDFLAATRPDYIWIRSDLPVVSTLLAGEWRPLFKGPRSVLLARGTVANELTRSPEPAPQGVAEIGTRCFPGP